MGLLDIIREKFPVRKEKVGTGDVVPGIWTEIDNLHRELQRVIDRFLGTTLEPSLAETSFLPRLEVSEDDNNFYVKAELPGMDKNDIEILITQDTLTIKGEKKEEKEEKKDQIFHTKEFSYGYFERTIALPDGLDVDNAEASYKDGILSITIPKKEEKKGKKQKIEIK